MTTVEIDKGIQIRRLRFRVVCHSPRTCFRGLYMTIRKLSLPSHHGLWSLFSAISGDLYFFNNCTSTFTFEISDTVLCQMIISENYNFTIVDHKLCCFGIRTVSFRWNFNFGPRQSTSKSHPNTTSYTTACHRMSTPYLPSLLHSKRVNLIEFKG